MSNLVSELELALLGQFLDLIWLEGVPHMDAMQRLSVTGAQLIAWRKGELYQQAYQERQALARSIMWERTAIELASSLRRKAKLDELDGHALVQGVGRLAELLGWDQQAEQQPQPGAAAGGSTGLPFLKGVFGEVLQREQAPKPKKEVKPVIKSAKDPKPKGTKKGKGGSC